MCLTICCLCGSCVLLCLALLSVPVAYHYAEKTLQPGEGKAVKFFANDQVEHVLPLAPASYPEAFQGIIWMDQAGVYGHSDLPMGAPDLALSFGDSEFSAWDPATRTLAVDVVGPGWVWMNQPLGYVTWWLMTHLGFHYKFHLFPGDDYIQVYPGLNLGMLGKWYMPTAWLSFAMLKVKNAPEGMCPPKPGTKKKDIVKCAQWDRLSHGFFSPLLLGAGQPHYYVYQIVDGKGNRVQPYYDAYISFADNSCKPRAEAATLFGISATQAADCPKAFVGIRSQTSPGGASVSKGNSKSIEL